MCCVKRVLCIDLNVYTINLMWIFCQTTHMHTEIDIKKHSLCKLKKNNYVFKKDLIDDSDGAYLISFRLDFHTEAEAK